MLETDEQRIQRLYESDRRYTQKEFDKTSIKHFASGILFGLAIGFFVGYGNYCGPACMSGNIFHPVWIIPILLIVSGSIVQYRF